MVSAASIHEAQLRKGALPARIKPVEPGMRVWAPAFPVRVPVGNNLPLHWALDRARPGDVLVVDGGDAEFGYWGEILACAAHQRGLAGLVIDGGVRDIEVLRAGPLPVFASRVTMLGTGKDADPAATLGEPITLGTTVVGRGDLVVGDADGVVVVAAERVEEITARAAQRERDEQAIMERIQAGASTVEIYGLIPAPSGGVTG